MCTTALLIAPCIYGVYQITYDTASPLTRVVMGIFSAALLSGVLNWLGNEVWYRARLKKYKANKKAARKGKRKKK